MMYGPMGGGHWLWMLVVAILVVVPVWRICVRIGYPGVLSLLMLVPLLNLGLLYFIAFAEWRRGDSEPPAAKRPPESSE